MQTHGDEWRGYFASLGYTDAHPLAAGMEGAVYRLGSGLIGKVWARRSIAELLLLQRFYRDISAQRLRFRTPEIRDIIEVRGVPLTLELELPGLPLHRAVVDSGTDLSSAAQRCILEVLIGLASVRETESMRRLAVLDETRSLWRGCPTWGNALTGLVERRIARFGDQLRGRVDHFDAKLARVVELLRSQDTRTLSLIHGDLVPANIHVDDSLRPRLLLYKAVYAIATSNVYDPVGADGHAAWCIAMLQRDDISALLLGPAP